MTYTEADQDPYEVDPDEFTSLNLWDRAVCAAWGFAIGAMFALCVFFEAGGR